ncbi:MAG TPA: hypothetical protein VMB91_11775 [Solirubrobacteraceae bacterium]|nr:hypothetical protein [Solirubrobacteraceae bacterium]
MAAVAVVAVVVGVVLAVTGGSGHKQDHHSDRVAVTRERIGGGGEGPSAARGSGGISGGTRAGGGRASAPRGDVAAASDYFGISKAKLRKELDSGRSLAALAASSPGHSALGLVEAIMRPRVSRIEAQVAAKRLSQAEAQRMIQRIRKRVQTRLARSTTYEPTAAVAERYLGLSATELRSRLHGGRTLGQLADGTAGRSATGLIAAVMAVRVAELVHGAGASSEARLRHETGLLKALEARVKQEVREGGPALALTLAQP